MWQSNSWKITTQLRWISQLALFQLFDDVFYNFKGGLYRLALLVPFIFMNGGLQNMLIFASIFAVSCLIWRAKEKWRPAEYIAEVIIGLAALWFYPVPAIFACLAGLFVLVDVLVRSARPMVLTNVILFGAIGATIVLLFGRVNYGVQNNVI